MKVQMDGTVIAGVDQPNSNREYGHQGRLDLQPDPAGLRDLAARFRDDAAAAKGNEVRESFIKAAEEAESRAEIIEASALWMAPTI